MTTFGFIGLSADKQEQNNQKLLIIEYCNLHKMNVDIWKELTSTSNKSINKRKRIELLEEVNKDDLLVVSQLSKLGRSIGQVLTFVNMLLDKGANFISIGENIRVFSEDRKNKDEVTQTTVGLFSLFAEIERDLISQRNREGLKAARAKGKLLGRPPGGSILDGKEKMIKKELSFGVSVSAISRKLKCDRLTVSRFIDTKNLKPK